MEFLWYLCKGVIDAIGRIVKRTVWCHVTIQKILVTTAEQFDESLNPNITYKIYFGR